MIPEYSELPDGDAVGVFGSDDVVGSLNRQTPDSVVKASGLVSSGRTFSLNAPLDWPDPPLYTRKPVEHHVFVTPRGHLDDWLDAFYPQASSQWDGFLHMADPVVGRYNRRPDHELGIENFATKGIVGRFVLADLARHRELNGSPMVWNQKSVVSIDELRECLQRQGVVPESGDVLLVRTGWTTGYQQASDAERAALRGGPVACPGLAGDTATAAQLWDWGIAAVAADNPSFEASPTGEDRLHPKLLGRLGIPIGELWWLDALADDCRSDARYDGLLVSAPLHLRGGVGSPANAIAVK